MKLLLDMLSKFGAGILSPALGEPATLIGQILSIPLRWLLALLRIVDNAGKRVLSNAFDSESNVALAIEQSGSARCGPSEDFAWTFHGTPNDEVEILDYLRPPS